MPGEYRTRELQDDLLIVTHHVDDSHEGWRADNYLKTQYKHFSRNKLHGLIDQGRVAIIRGSIGAPDHAKLTIKPSTTIRIGDKIVVSTRRSVLDEPKVDLNFSVLFEDDHVLVVNKTGNLPVHPAGKFLFNTLLMHLRKERSDWLKQGHDFYLIHRLDRETSGVLLLAKTQPMAGELVKQFRERKTEKRYFAVVLGHCKDDAFTVDADIGSAPNSHIRLKMAGFPKGTGEMDALTHFKVARRGKSVDLLDCKLETGRQHQIRVHLSYYGNPVVGDKLYGTNDHIFLDHINRRPLSDEAHAHLRIERQALHSRYLKFFHKPRNEWMEIEAPLPKDMEALLEQ